MKPKAFTAVKVTLAFISGVLMLLWIQQKSTVTRISPQEVWDHIEAVVPQYDLDSGFIFSIVMAESQLNSRAKNHGARGIMQIKKKAWKTVTDKDFAEAWDWQMNITMGIRYLDYCRGLLKESGKFSHELLAASYRFGPNAVKDAEYDMKKLPNPKNAIYRKLFSGELRPVYLKEHR